MKKIKIIYITFCSALLLTTVSCEKVLDVTLIGQNEKQDALKSEADLIALLNSGYASLSSDNFYGGRLQVTNELLGDYIDGRELGGDESEVYRRNASFFNGQLNSMFEEGYRAINRVNNALDNLDLASTNKSSIEGQAKFIRAIAHFELVRLYAQPYGFTQDNLHLGIPLRLDSKPSGSVRVTVKEVYAQIIKDLTEAETLLPDVSASGEFAKANKLSAKAFLAKVYFQTNNFAKAYDYANQVIISNKFIMDADYSKRFTLGTAAGYASREVVFGLINERNIAAGTRFNTLKSFKSDLSLPTLRIDAAFYISVKNNANDVRKGFWYDDTKYSDKIVSKKFNTERVDLPLVYLTELKLIRAESASETNANLAVAITDINDIMTRAYGGISRNIPAGASAQLIKNTARQERMFELVGEGNRVQELKRQGAKGESITIRNAPWNCPGLVLPFPNGEVANSPGFVQNPIGGTCN